MAINTELDKGQIAPSARPVEAFIQPSQINVAAPNQLAQMGNPSGMRTVQTGGTFSIAGENSFQRLATELAAFNPAITQALQGGGLMYVQGQIAEGEKRAREQVLQAMAQNDRAQESDELKRAAMNRALAAKDPQAGGFMAMLNPYQQIGWERGKSKMAAQEAQMGLPAYIAQNGSKIDYTAPDQGFGALAQLQAQYTAQLAQKYGVNASSPGFQKYTLPEIEKAQERIQTKHLQDRKDYFDTVGVQQTSAQIRQMYLTTESSGVVEINGQIFSRAADPTRFRQMQQFKAQSIIDNLLLRQSMPGEAGKRSESVYQELAKISDYQLDDNFNKFIDSLPSQQVLKDENGKAVINPATGRPFTLSWGEVYRGTAIDSEIKYEEAAATRKERNQKRALEAGQAEGGFEDGLYTAIQGIPPGPQQQAAADAFVDQWYREKGAALGISRSELAKRRSQLVKLDDTIYSEGSDPTAGSRFFVQLNESYGSSFNATQQRQRMFDAASRIKDPEKKESFIKEASSAIASREKEMQSFSGYSRARDEVLDQAVKSNLASYYDMTSLSDDPRAKANVEASKTRQMSAFVPRANDLIAKEEARLKRRLTETEVRKIARAAVFGDADLGVKPYGSGDGSSGKSGQNQKEYLFPGSKKTDEPSAPTPGRSRPAGKTYELSQLNTIQDRRVLRQYKAAAVLTPEATLQAWRMVQRGDIPPALNRAYRDAGASSAAEFVLGQLDVQRRLLSQKGLSGAELDKFNPPADVRSRVLKQSTRAAAGGNTVQSVASNLQSTPLLAQLGGSVLNALTGAAPAAAGTLDSAPRQYGGGRKPVGQVKDMGHGWVVDEAGNFFSPTDGSPTVQDPITNQRPAVTRRLIATRSDYSSSFTGSPAVGKFRAAIIGKESGGNYNAVNPDSGALGIGQVMPYNVGPWTRKYLGQALTPQQFLRDRNAQDAVVNGRFNDMLADQRKAGYKGEQAIRRAAAVWYSGQAGLWNDTRPQYSGGRKYPSIAEYTQAIWDHYRRN